jgi:glycosyltransferase involved in cell wall biosynthesis
MCFFTKNIYTEWYMNSPLISIIIPMHNSEKFIEECLDSVVSQTYENIEVIVVNDNSTDSSDDIAKTYTKKYENITLVSVNNSNAALTRRDGIKKASADLICFLDSDDIVDKKYVEYLYRAMTETGTDMAACQMAVFSGDYETHESPTYGKATMLESSASVFAKHYYINDDNNLLIQTLPCKIFKKRLFDDIDYDVLKTNLFEDNFIMVQVLRKIEVFGVVTQVLYGYRQASGSTSSEALTTRVDYNGIHYNLVEFFKDVVMEYCRKKLKGKDVDAAIDKLCATEFYNYARMLPDVIVDQSSLQTKLQMSETRLIDRDAKLERLLSSKEYEIGTSIMKRVNKLKKIVRKGNK